MTDELLRFLTTDLDLAPKGFIKRATAFCDGFAEYSPQRNGRVVRPIRTVAELCALTDNQMLGGPGMGQKMVDHLRYIISRANGVTPAAGAICSWCGEAAHKGRCPLVRSLEYYDNGALKRVEFFPADELEKAGEVPALEGCPRIGH